MDTKRLLPHGKVEIIDSEIAGPESISDLEINATILPKHVLATGKGSRIALLAKCDWCLEVLA